jgi:hypothetical protein
VITKEVNMNLARGDADRRPVRGPAEELGALIPVDRCDNCSTRQTTDAVASQRCTLTPVPASHEPCRRADPAACTTTALLRCSALGTLEIPRPSIACPATQGSREAADLHVAIDDLVDGACDGTAVSDDGDAGDLSASRMTQQTAAVPVQPVEAARDTWTRPLDAVYSRRTERSRQFVSCAVFPGVPTTDGTAVDNGHAHQRFRAATRLRRSDAG